MPPILSPAAGPAAIEYGYSQLAEVAAEMISFKESHQFYSVLLYFRFREPQYAMSRLALVCLDAMTLMKSALNDEKHGWPERISCRQHDLAGYSCACWECWRFRSCPGGLPDPPRKWTMRRVSAGGIDTSRPSSACTRPGLKRWLTNSRVRRIIAICAFRWDRYIRIFADHMLHQIENIDPIGENPAEVGQRQDFGKRLRAAG